MGRATENWRLGTERERSRSNLTIAPLVADLHRLAVLEAHFHQLLAIDELAILVAQPRNLLEGVRVVNRAGCRIHTLPVDAAGDPP